jgi:hypothetical protein
MYALSFITIRFIVSEAFCVSEADVHSLFYKNDSYITGFQRSTLSTKKTSLA